MNQIKINLYEKQYNIVEDWLTINKHCLTIVPVGSGKTFMASVVLPIFASDEKYHNGKDIIYSAPTMGMIKSLIWEPLKESCRKNFNIPEANINNSEMTIKFPNKVFIRCKSAEQRENLRGLNVGRWIADEAALYSEEVLMEIFNRLRPRVGAPESGGKMIIISTPLGNGPLYSLYQTAEKDTDNFIIHHYTYDQMRSGHLPTILKMKEILSPLKFAADYLCSFETVADQLYYAWDKHKFTKSVKDDNRPELYSFHDFNKKCMAAVVCKVDNPYTQYGKIEVLKSYAIPDCSTEMMAQTIRQDFKERRINSIMDMSGAQVNRDTTSPFGVTDRTLLEKYGFTIINNKKGNPLISDTDNSANSFISQGRLTVDPDDTKMIEALQTYHYEDGARKKLVKYSEAKFMHIDGLGDALRYGIHHLFGIKHDSSNQGSYVTSDQSGYVRPGTEYMPYSPIFPGGPTMQELFKQRTSNDAVEY